MWQSYSNGSDKAINGYDKTIQMDVTKLYKLMWQS